jgi:pimeloyl-ACP methyl ester carboxylesterase
MNACVLHKKNAVHIIARISLAACVGLTACGTHRASQSGIAPVFEPRTCVSVPDVEGLRCGVVRVPEDYGAVEGRHIELNVVVLPAISPVADRVAQFDLDGGPGFDATFFAHFYAREGAHYRISRDIVLADMRGTGNSNPLRCPMLEAFERNNGNAAMYPPPLVAECARFLGAKADLTSYSTAAAARDIDQIRRALGYAQFDLFALSYGTTLAMRYIADFPARARAAVFIGTVPATRAPPRYHAIAANRALTMLLADCMRDTLCDGAFPALRADLDRAVQRLHDAGSSLSADAFMEKLRTLMYVPASARQVPFLIHRAAEGDLEPLLAATKSSGDRPFADGLYLSITCAETFAHIDAEAAIAAAAKTLFAAYRLERQRAACKEWPRGKPDSKLFSAENSNTPVLFLSGALDPVSPPEWAAEVAARYRNSRQIIIPAGGHLFDGLSGLESCFDQLVLDFLASGSVNRLNASCVEQMKPGPYRIS